MSEENPKTDATPDLRGLNMFARHAHHRRWIIGIAFACASVVALFVAVRSVWDNAAGIRAVQSLPHSTIQFKASIWPDSLNRFGFGTVEHVSFYFDCIDDLELQRLIPHLSKMSGLHWLSIDSSRLSNSGVKQLAELKQVEGLFLMCPAIGDEGVEHFRDMPNLNTLGLKGNVTDASVGNLEKLRKLHTLLVHDTMITDQGVDEISKWPSRLKQLNVPSTTVSQAAIDRVRKAMPGIAVFQD